MADTPQTAAGTLTHGEVGGVPVVDLTGTVRGLYEHAEVCRQAALAAERVAAGQRRQADYLEDLARVLSGA